jgi:hypothetical protein
MVSALLEAPDGTIYAGTGPGGVIVRIRQGQADHFELPGVGSIFSLALDAEGRLLAGTGGENGKVIRVNLDAAEPQVEDVFSAEGVRYVWRIAPGAEGALYVATGPDASLYEVRPGAEARKLFTAPGENNILSLAVGEDALYVGTDPSGLIFQVNRQTGESRVIFDAAEPEITALVLSGRSLWATGAARAAEPMPPEDPGAGTPDVLGQTAPITQPPVDLPVDPDLPPPEPDRLPLEGFQDVQDPPQDAPPEDELQDMDEMDPDDEPEGFGPPLADFAGEGSAIYRIDLSNGALPAVSGVLRDPAMFLDLLEQNGRLLVAAGAGEGEVGRVLQLDPGTNELALLAQPNARQVSAMLPLSDGRVLLGLSNPAGVAVLSATYAEQGTLTSPALDAGAISQFGTVQLSGRLPEGTQLLLSTRSGNSSDPAEDAPGWGPWSEPVEARRFVATQATPGRFFQYRLTFQGGGAATPSVERVRVAYMTPNLPPQVSALHVTSELTDLEVQDIVENALQSGAPPSTLRAIEWEAADPNGDPLRFDLYLRTTGRGDFQLLAEDLAEPNYAWDAAATGDGIYEFRVVAKDARGNRPGAGLTGSRVSEPIEVDLTAPRIGDIEISRDGEATRLTLRVADGQGIVARLEYLLTGDPADPASWIRAFPEDNMADSPQERYVLNLADIPAAGATLRLRAVDDSGNLGFQTLTIPAR